jgi:glucosylceramidase
MSYRTRRDFLKMAGAGAAAVANSVVTRGATWTEGGGHASSKEELQVWVTDDDRRLAQLSPVRWAAPNNTIPQDAIVLLPERKYQEILGFGAAFTDGSCFMFHQIPEAERARLFHDLFAPSEMGLNVCRTCIGAADNAAQLYSYDDGAPDPDLSRFSIAYDRAYILPILRQARKENPDLFLFSSPWSPPGWMKDNGSMLGGCMRHTYMPSYAKYFVKFLRSYEAEGVPVQAITVQNEVDADQEGLMAACFWPQDYEADFVRYHLGPEFVRSGIKAKIWIIDHNYNLWGRAVAELETPGVRKYTNSVAWHGYTGEPEWMSRVQEVFPDVEMHWTEGSPDHNDPEYLRCWALWAGKFSTILRNSCRSVTGWSFATDEHGRPNIGPYPCGGMLTIDSKTKVIYHSGQYFAMGHFSRFVKRGAVRIGSEGQNSCFSHCAFDNRDGSRVLVITNPGEPRACEVRLHDRAAQLALTANSVTTLVSPAASGV